MALICRIVGHRPVQYAARKGGHHVTGELCRRCGRVLSVRAGSRQERRALLRQAASR